MVSGNLTLEGGIQRTFDNRNKEKGISVKPRILPPTHNFFYTILDEIGQNSRAHILKSVELRLKTPLPPRKSTPFLTCGFGVDPLPPSVEKIHTFYLFSLKASLNTLYIFFQKFSHFDKKLNFCKVHCKKNFCLHRSDIV